RRGGPGGPGVRGGGLGGPGVRGGGPGGPGIRDGGPGIRDGGPDRASSSRSPIWISRVRIPAIASWNWARMSRWRATPPSGAASGSFGPAPPSGCGVSPRAIIRHYRRLSHPCTPYAQKNVVALRNCVDRREASSGFLRTLAGLDRQGAEDAAHVFLQLAARLLAPGEL